MFCFLYRAWLYMSNTESVLKERELLTLRVHLSSLTGFGWVFPRAPEFTNGFGWVFLRNLFSFLCCDIFLCIACLRPVSCVPCVASFPDCPGLIAPSVFSNVYFQMYSDHMSLVSGTNRTLVVIWEKIISKFLLSWKLSDRYCIL